MAMVMVKNMVMATVRGMAMVMVTAMVMRRMKKRDNNNAIWFIDLWELVMFQYVKMDAILSIWS